MSIFTQPFFSGAGQKERLTNVVQTLKSSLTGKGVQANTGSPIVNKVLGAAASNPLTTAAVITPMNTIGAAKAGFSALSTGGKVAVAVATPVIAGAVISNPKIITKTAQTPSALANVGSNVGKLIDNPTWEQTKETFKENPVITGGLVAAGGLLIGKGVSSTIATLSNTAAVKENTKVASAAGTNLVSSLQPTSQGTTPVDNSQSVVPSYNYLPVETMTRSYSSKSVSTKRKTKKSKPLYSSPVTVRNNINIFNKND